MNISLIVSALLFGGIGSLLIYGMSHDEEMRRDVAGCVTSFLFLLLVWGLGLCTGLGALHGAGVMIRRSQWMAGLLEAEKLYKKEGRHGLLSWWNSYEMDYLFETCPKYYDGVHSYLIHIGLSV